MIMKKLFAVLMLVLFSAGAAAQPTDAAGSYYTIEPDYRLCPSPSCGGWWLTKVNVYTIADKADLLDPSVLPVVSNPVYVAAINYKALGLSDREIAAFESNIYQGRAFIRGVLQSYPLPYPNPSPLGINRLQQLAATGTWLAANDNVPRGPYLRVRNSGIVCITTPCPYYDVEVLNTNYRTRAHELDLKHANLTLKQTELAKREVNGKGLVMTGVKFVSQGQTGTGLGIAATRVFFTFPGPAF